MDDNHHHRLELLQLDIEGAEYNVVDSVVGDGLDIAVVCIEYDEYYHPVDRDFRKRFSASMNKLNSAGYCLVCAQENANYIFMRQHR